MKAFQLFPNAGQAHDVITPGMWLLEASAGTGKTYTIAGLVARMVIEDGIPLERIAVMTFTNEATAQLRERVRGTLSAVLAAVQQPPAPAIQPQPAGQAQSEIDPFISWLARSAVRAPGRDRLRAALTTLDASPIMTIHGFCQRLLQAHGLALGTPVDFELGRDLGQWRSDWCREQLRHWACASEVRDWFALDLVPSLRHLERWAKKLEPHPDCQLPRAPEVPRCAELMSALEHTRQLFRPEVLGTKEIDLKRIAAAQALLAGSGDSSDIAVLAKTTAALKAKHPELARVAELCIQALAVTEALELHFLHGYAAALLHRLAQSDGTLAYQDLLIGVVEGLRGPQGAALAGQIGASYDAVLVDEFQDTDDLQWEILQRCFGNGRHRLVLIGDPKQSIYRFRGADVETYLRARQQAPDANRRMLTTNFRTDRSLHQAVQQLFLANPDPFVHAQITLAGIAAQREDRFHPGVGIDPSPLEVYVVEPESDRKTASLIRQVAAGSARCIRDLLMSGSTIISGSKSGMRPVTPRDVTVLVTSHGEAESMRAALRALGIAATTQGRESVFASLEALELRALLRAWLEPKRSTLHSAALTRLGGLTPHQVNEASAELTRFAQACSVSAERWHQCDLLSAWYLWRDQAGGANRRLAMLEHGERALVNIQHLVDLLAEEQRRGQHSAAGTLTWLEQSIFESGDERAADHHLPRLDRDDEAVRILTIHSSKGLQFPVVVLPFAWIGKQWEKLKMVVDADGRRWVPGSGAGNEVPQYYSEALAEQARLLYVALTRAQHRCLIVWCGVCSKIQKNRTYSVGSPLGMLLLGTGGPFPDAITAWSGEDRNAEFTRAGCQALRKLGLTPKTLPASGDIPYQQKSPSGDQSSDIPVISAGAARQRWPSSYSGLVRRIESDDDRDVDREAEPASLAGSGGRTDVLPDMPSGASFGVIMHAVFEQALRQEDPLRQFEPRASLLLTQAGVPAAVIPVVVERIRSYLASSLPGGSVPLAAIPKALRAVEVPFALPVMQSADIARVFAEHPLVDYPDYDQRLRGLQIAPGLFNGVIDLLVKDGDAWQVVDWKSNRLQFTGSGVATVAPDQQMLRRNMRDHHYPLQYALYAVAVRRLLKLRSLGRHQALGKAHYAYVRYGSWVSAMIEPVLLDALDEAMGGAHG